MKQEIEQEEYKKILELNFKKMRESSLTNSVKITSEFIRTYYGAANQAKLGLKDITDFEDALLMNGLAGLDCEALGLDFSELSQEEFERIPFDSKTIFSEETKRQFEPQKILERGKKFGLGLETLGLTGKEIHVAIRDENCNPYLTGANIVEYTNIVNGDIYHEVNSDDIEHMHGVTTTSLLASKSCGIAKDSSVHFFSGTIDEYVEHIIAYNQKCKAENRESDMILVASGSWADRNFDVHRERLRENGCELVCANNFNENFGEFVNNSENAQNPLELAEEQIEEFKEKYPKMIKQIETMCRKKEVNIPISRTYHQVGREHNGEEIFKYQSAYSTSWGVPQIAGLLTVFKEMDRTLTFDEFLEYARETAQGKMKIINPVGILEKVREKIKDKSEEDRKKGKSGLEDCMQDEKVSIASIKEATTVVNNVVLDIKEREIGE